MNTLPVSPFYTPGQSSLAVDIQSRRTAGTHAAFALPLLRPGMRILDCGCGPGSISLGLAECVRPGGVIGIDVKSSLLQQANENAAERKLNAAFIQADVSELPFGSAEFDGVFAHSLFENLTQPVAVLRELRRVMKPGAFIALRSPDWGGCVLEPLENDVAEALSTYQQGLMAQGGDVFAGRKLPTWLRAAGFHHVTPSASYEIYPSTALMADALAQQLACQGHDEEAQSLRTWSLKPGALFAQSWFEAVGWKPWI